VGELDLTIDIEPAGPAGAIVLSDEQVADLGAGRRAPVTVRVGDRVTRVRLAVMGGRNLIGLSRAARAELGVEIGDRVRVHRRRRGAA